jgi:phosphoenolpyruvate carboxylase
VFEAIEFCRHRYGASSVGSYVVTLPHDVDDLLSVLLLARWAGMADPDTGHVPLDVAPLFESVETLEQAGPMVERLLADPVYRAHLASRNDQQIVMMGYSDSNKAAGIVSSRWLLRRAQEAMVAASEASGARLVIFHGRGGAVSRSGGRTVGLIRSLPPGAMRGRFRLTEQGESVNDRYGLRPIALRTFEQNLNAVALMTAGSYGPELVDTRWVEAMGVLAEASIAAYRGLVHADPAFADYFHSVTPIDVIERMQIGSRPLVRPSGSGIAALRAIPWVFAWSQSRHMLPGWFGAGAALAVVAERYGDGILNDMYGRWPFFEALIDDIEMSLARADMGIAKFYDQLAGRELQRHGHAIHAEFDASVERVLVIKGCARLLDSEPTLQRSIRLRNPYVDPLHLTQVDLLNRWRQGGREDRDLFEAVVASVNGIAQGLHGSG